MGPEYSGKVTFSDDALASVEGLKADSDDLHVLLRHRSPRISCGVGSANGEPRAESPGREGRRYPPLSEMSVLVAEVAGSCSSSSVCATPRPECGRRGRAA